MDKPNCFLCEKTCAAIKNKIKTKQVIRMKKGTVRVVNWPKSLWHYGWKLKPTEEGAQYWEKKTENRKVYWQSIPNKTVPHSYVCNVLNHGHNIYGTDKETHWKLQPFKWRMKYIPDSGTLELEFWLKNGSNALNPGNLSHVITSPFPTPPSSTE